MAIINLPLETKIDILYNENLDQNMRQVQSFNFNRIRLKFKGFKTLTKHEVNFIDNLYKMFKIDKVNFHVKKEKEKTFNHIGMKIFQNATRSQL